MNILIETLLPRLARDVVKICLDYCERKEVFMREYNVYGGCIHGITIFSGEIYIVRVYGYPFRIEVQKLEEKFLKERDTSDKGPYSGSSNEIYIADPTDHCIRVFSPEGKYIRKWGSKGHEAGEFNIPYSVAISKRNEIYVADYMNDRVQVFTHEGKLHAEHATSPRCVSKWDLCDERGIKIQFPTGIAVSTCNEVYVTSLVRNCVYVYTSRGKFLREWGVEYGGHPSEITISSRNEIYITDCDNHRIYVYTSKGELLRRLEHPHFSFPGSITIVQKSALYEEIYITNDNNGYIQVFGYDLA